MMYCFPAKELMKSQTESFIGYFFDNIRDSQRYSYSTNSFRNVELPDIEEVNADLLFCKNNYDIRFDFEEESIWLENYKKITIVVPKLFFTTKEIILSNSKGEQLNFGRFEIELSILKSYDPSISRYLIYDRISANALDPKPSRHSSHIFHPNISQDTICLGEGDSAVHIALQQGRFSDAIELIISVLNTHSEAPYLNIDDWDKLACRNCGEGIDEGEEINCDACDSEGCKKCASDCPNCGDFIHNGCCRYCETCQSDICPCKYGGGYYCTDCDGKRELEREKEEQVQDNSSELEPF